MRKTLARIDPNRQSFQILIPKRVVLYKMWSDVEYVMIEDAGPDKLLIRRFIDGESLETDDKAHTS